MDLEIGWSGRTSVWGEGLFAAEGRRVEERLEWGDMGGGRSVSRTGGSSRHLEERPRERAGPNAGEGGI